MIRIDLGVLADQSSTALPSLLRRLDPDSGPERTRQQFEEVCLHLHTVAAASLLVLGDAGAFQAELARAAEQWLLLLRHQQTRGWRPPPATRNKPLLGAILARHWELARQIAGLSATAWQQGEEYEDDACWALVLQELAIAPADRARLAPQLARLEQLGGEQNRHRLAWARALLTGEADALAAAFAALLMLHGEEIERRARSITASEVKLAPYRHLWFEGLALLQLATRAGVPLPEDHYLYCPPLARAPGL